MRGSNVPETAALLALAEFTFDVPDALPKAEEAG
jgi:hypothetical protein